MQKAFLLGCVILSVSGCATCSNKSVKENMKSTNHRDVFVETKDKVKIHVDHYSYGHEKVVIIAHGFFNSKQAVLMKDLGLSLRDDYDVIIMDFRGHGKSQGLFYWTSKEYLDLLAVLDYAHQHYAKIGVIGFSLGAATSLIATPKTHLIDSLISVSGPSDFDKIEYHFWQLDPENDIGYNLFGEGKIGKGVRPGPWWTKKEKPIDAVKNIKIPVCFIHGKADWLIKPWHAEALYKATTSKKQLSLIDKGPHAEYLIRKNKKETVEIIRKWFEETM